MAQPRRTPRSNVTFYLVDGNEDNDLWLERTEDDHGNTVLVSTWEPSAEERAAIAEGANIELRVWGGGHPPVAITTNNDPLGKDGTDARSA